MSLAKAAQDDADLIAITKKGNQLVPVSISGFTGEAAAVVKFDLAVLGIVEVVPSQAQFLINGENNGRFEGRLTDVNKTQIFSRGYQGGSTRSMAHAFAEDVVKVLRPGLKPIFGTKVAFRAQLGGAMEIAVADYDGFNPTVLTHDKSLVNGPSWVPGTRKLLYASWKNGPTAIMEHNLSSGERKVFGKNPGSSYSPAVSPDGRRVAFISNRGGSPNVYVSDIDGGNVKQLTTGRDDKSSPCWSPDSQQICYVCRQGRASLYKISANGGTPKRLATVGAGVNMTEPDWSPDGKMIVFTSMGGGFNILTVPSEGGDATNLVAGEDPSWAPNSRTVIFTRRESNKRVLSLLDVPTKHVKDVLQISGSCSQPSWAR